MTKRIMNKRLAVDRLPLNPDGLLTAQVRTLSNSRSRTVSLLGHRMKKMDPRNKTLSFTVVAVLQGVSPDEILFGPFL